MIGQTVSHYEILEKLGEGGMGIVYKAHDLRLNRLVALKFLPPLLVNDPDERARFVHEAQAISGLNHPHIATIHDVEDTSEHKFIVLEFIEGGTLKHRIKHKHLPLRETLDYAIQIAEGLSYAHKKEIVHRDIKTDNVMITAEGQLKITDFGLAKFKGASRITRTGSTVGTASYMSPEQAQGVDVDQRSDIFSFGIVLYETVTGELPFKGEHEAALLYEIVNTPSIPLKVVRSDTPDELQRIVDKALTKTVQERYQHMDEMVVDLRRLRKELETREILKQTGAQPIHRKKSRWLLPAVSATAIFAALIAYFITQQQAESGSRIPVAVVDFTNETQEKELNGLSGLLITSLEQSRRLSVLTRSRMFDFLKQIGKQNADGIDESLGREICQQANLNALVIASIRKFGRLYTIDLKVLDPQSNTYLFTATEQAEGQESIPSMIDRLSEKTRQGLKENADQIQKSSRSIADVTTANLDAYQHFYLGEHLINKLKFKDAQEEFRKAIALDSTFGLAYYRLAYAIQWQVMDEQLAHAPIQKALEHINRIPEKERYLVRAVKSELEGGISSGAGILVLKEMERMYPEDKEMLYNIGDWSFHQGDFHTSVQYLTKVLEMDATFERALEHLTWTYRAMKNYDKMVEYAKRFAAVSISEESYQLLSSAYELSGNPDVAEQTLYKAQDIFPQKRRDFGVQLAKLYFKRGKDQKGELEINRIVRNLPTDSARVERKNIFIQLGWAFFSEGNFKPGETFFRKAIALEPAGKDVNIYNGLGWNLFRQNRNEEAKGYFLKGFAIDFQHPAILNGLWNVCVALKEYNSALSYLQSYGKVGSNFVPKTFLLEQTGRIHLLRGDYAAAEQSLKNSLALDSTKAGSQRLLGYVFSAQGRFRDAQVPSEKSFSTDTTYPSYNLLSWVLIAGDVDVERGLTLAHHALNSKPTEWLRSLAKFVPIPEHTLGLGYLKTGDYEKAVKYLEEATKLVPERQSIRDDLDLARNKLKTKK